MFKKIIRSAFMQEVLAHIIALYMFLVRKTTKWEIIGAQFRDEFANGEKGVVAAYWHSRIMMAHSIWPVKQKPYNMMISLSADGQFVARAAEILGRKVVRGSSSKKRDGATLAKGAIKAFRMMVQAAKDGEASFITPDGPSGPRQRIQDGAIRMAKSAGVEILPIGMSIKGSKYMDSWDRFLIPPLFSKGIIIYGEPVKLDGNDAASLENARILLENRLNEITQKCDIDLGGPLIEPQDEVAKING